MEEEIKIKTEKETNKLLSWFLHAFIFLVGITVFCSLLYEWMFGSGQSPDIAGLVISLVFVLWGLAKVIHFRFVIFSFSLSFLGFALIGLQEGHIKLGRKMLTIYLDKDPVQFVLAIILCIITSIAAGVWAMRAKPTLPNQSLQSDAPKARR